jgi:transcriptional regulator with XRE-family HTH domain
MIINPKNRTESERNELRTFARRLSGLMAQRRMSQSDLARAIWGSTVDTRGRDVGKNRDRISNYVNARQMPEAKTVRKLADALGVAVTDLVPALDLPEGPGTRAFRGMIEGDAGDTTEMSMSVVGGTSPTMAMLRLRKVLPLGAAAQIMAIVADADRASQHEDTIQ